MSKILVFTDLHIVPEGQSIIGIDPSQRLIDGIAHANAMHGDADLVVITGDLTHYGDRASYERLKDHLSALKIPFLATIGNHDDRQTYRSVFADAVDDGKGFVAAVRDLADCRLILLDSKAEPGVHGGVLCADRMAFLSTALENFVDRPVLIFLHHPPLKTGFVGMDEIMLANGQAFYDLIGRYPNVRHVFAGHVHRTISGSHRGIPFSIFKSTAHQQPMPFMAEDTSLSIDEPGAYGIVLTTEEGLLVHTDDFTLDAVARSY